ncbi:MAG: hypothetical protein GY803_08915 [Chloroflexi bacterium]|nr:hypothetical protein [Chloroflexota bacterium]
MSLLPQRECAAKWLSAECFSLLHRSQIAVPEALDQLQERLPFPLLDIDSDNDGLFINDLTLKYCQKNSRSRPAILVNSAIFGQSVKSVLDWTSKPPSGIIYPYEFARYRQSIDANKRTD